MSKRMMIQKHLGTLGDIGGIMGAMKNISLMETHKLARFLAHQHRVLAGIEAAAADFLAHHPEIAYRPEDKAPDIVVAIGSQRGFCGDFNESLAQALRHHWRQTGGGAADVLVVGRRLAAKLGREPRIAATLDGPSVAEEVQPVLQRLMDALGELHVRAGENKPLTISVFAHREGESRVGVRPILPAPEPGRAAPRFAYPPMLNLEAEKFFAGLARHYLWAQMHDAFYGSLMAESRLRLQHMEGAMQRMEEKSGELRRKYNLLRQEEITEEIEVIMLSNEALQRSRRGKAVGRIGAGAA
ncbi:MAG: F0F1 ATP synthase subunit gamma [Nitrosomonadales bacterium]|nr:F0F1 ATP synthase subunit gamma [Nitrosomonadales bacterium]